MEEKKDIEPIVNEDKGKEQETESKISKAVKKAESKLEEEENMLEAFIGKDSVNILKGLLKSVNDGIKAYTANEIEKTKLKRQSLDNDSKRMDIDVKKLEIHKKAQQEQYDFIAGFDLRNKVYSLLTLVILLLALGQMFNLGIADKQTVTLLFGIIGAAVAVASKDSLQGYLSKYMNQKDK